MRIFMARHGETDWNVERRIQGSTDIPLNENGIRQAHSLAGYLERQVVGKGGTITHIFTSPLERAKETAEIVGARLRVPVEAVSGLEEMNFGICEGKSCWRQRPCTRKNFPSGKKISVSEGYSGENPIRMYWTAFSLPIRL